MSDLSDELRRVLESAKESPGIIEYAVLSLGAALEYVFPPFPGDAVVLMGAFLVGRHGWSGPSVWIAVGVGTVMGLTVDFAFGVWVRHRDDSWRKRFRWWGRMGSSIDRFDAFYRRWGALCIVANRFVPALRAVFFVAAGMAGIRYWKVLVLGLISAAAWNALLFWAGLSVGYNWERLAELTGTYSRIAWTVGGVVVVAFLVRWWLLRRRAARMDSSGTDGGGAQDDGTPRTS